MLTATGRNCFNKRLFAHDTSTGLPTKFSLNSKKPCRPEDGYDKCPKTASNPAFCAKRSKMPSLCKGFSYNKGCSDDEFPSQIKVSKNVTSTA